MLRVQEELDTSVDNENNEITTFRYNNYYEILYKTTLTTMFQNFLLKRYDLLLKRLPHNISVSGISKQCYNYQENKWILPRIDDISKNLLDVNRTCGQDAFSISSNQDKMIVCVADGVGGWAREKIDSGILSHKLCAYINEVSSKITYENNMNAVDILNVSYKKLVEEGNKDKSLAGSTTICVMKIEKYNNQLKLDFVNVGDCGLCVIRDAVMIYEAPITVHNYNSCGNRVPYQLAILPNTENEQRNMKYKHFMESFPDDGAQGEFILQANDKIIVASDGILDNLVKFDLIFCKNSQDLVQKAVSAGFKVDDMIAMVITISK